MPAACLFFVLLYMKMDKKLYDVLVIGGGPCGLMAASILAKKGKITGVIEAKQRLGGRIHSFSGGGFSEPVEMGAEFIHGDLPFTTEIFKKKNTSTYKVTGEMWNYFGNAFFEEDLFEQGDEIKKIYDALESDIPVSDFVELHLNKKKYDLLKSSIIKYVQGYHAADPSKASSRELLKDFFTGEENDFRIKGSYSTLIAHLKETIDAGNGDIILSAPVIEIEQKEGYIIVKTLHDEYYASQVMVTISLGCLQKEIIKFTPSLPQVSLAANQLGFGAVIKFVFEFSTPFWIKARNKDLSKMLFVFSEQEVPTWWTQYPEQKNILTGWLAGPAAFSKSVLSEEELIDQAFQSIAEIFDQPLGFIRQQCRAKAIANWVSDPFTNGGYSYEVVNSETAKTILMTPVNNRIFFAGEALQIGSELGTVEAALKSGKETALRLV
jgi:monoamine oxidase